MPRALITGITGQDGSYLAEFLLEKEYEVIGMVRRTSTVNFSRIQHIQDKITLVSGDLLDQGSLIAILRDYQPDEVYNLAAQSFVPTSWDQPVFTGEVTALGVTRMLEAIRTADPSIRFYQASSSEMFGKVRQVPQNEDTPFYPRSPYGVAKVYGHWITVNYRESFGIYAISGILFNHECVTAETPVIIRRAGLIDILPVEDIVPHRTEPKVSRYVTEIPEEADLQAWDAHGWTQVTCMTATWNDFQKKPNKVVYRIAARGAIYQVTACHRIFVQENGEPRERKAEQVQEGNLLALVDMPEPTNAISMTEDEAWLLGVLVADGYIGETGKIQIANQDDAFLQEVERVARKVTGCTVRWGVNPGGFEGGQPVTQLYLVGANEYGRYIRPSIYTRSGDKRVPQRVLNAGPEARLAFLRGYNAADGLKSGYGNYEFKSFKTASATLAAGLYWLAHTTLKQRLVLSLEEREGGVYYQINLNSPSPPGEKGAHLRRPLEEVVKAVPITYRGWLFDLATESGTFHAGVGRGWIHNSPRRGLEFVTRKVSYGVAKIKLGLACELRLGNLDARRDWGFAGDYVRAMWLMLQQPAPDDYVVGTGETHSVRELCEIAFSYVGLDWRDYVVQDYRYMRPAEVDLLVADPSKARRVLGWEPTVTFEKLVHLMIDADLQLLKQEYGL